MQNLLSILNSLEFPALFHLTSFSEGTYRYHVEMENEEVELEIADTAGEVWCCLSFCNIFGIFSKFDWFLLMIY